MQDIFSSIVRFIKKWNELWSLPIAIILWYISPAVIHYFDPQAGTFDNGILQKIILAIVFILVFNFLAWLGIMANFTEIWRYFDRRFSDEFNFNLSPWERAKAALLVFFGFLFALILLVKA